MRLLAVLFAGSDGELRVGELAARAGVAQATASFREGRITALIDPAQTNRAALETALKQRNVELKSP